MHRAHYTVLIGMAALLWAIALLIRGEQLHFGMLKPFSLVVSGVVGAVYVFDRWCWRWRLFKGWLVNRPDVSGTWHVELVSDWKNPETGEGVPPIEGFMYIYQTYTKLELRQMTKESSSDCIATSVLARKDGGYEIAAVYRNEPKAEVRHRSEIHHGGMALTVHGDPPTEIDGNYWTSRKTIGDMKLFDRKKKRYTSFDQAKLAWESDGV